MLASASTPITLFKPKPEYYEQSSEEIWHSICCSIQSILKKSEIDPSDVRGVGFDATCSLYVVTTTTTFTTTIATSTSIKHNTITRQHKSQTKSLSILLKAKNRIEYLLLSLLMEFLIV
jgi:ribulose kinase